MDPRASALRLASVRLLCLATIVALLPSGLARAQVPPTPATVYVNAAATPPGDGTTWATAYTSLDTAILSQLPTGQIWVVNGQYFPASLTTGFLITKQLKLYGGFVGNETSVQGRQGSFGRTYLDGNPAAAPPGLLRAKHVVSISLAGSSGSPGVVIDGFTIQNGWARDPAIAADQIGGGISCDSDLDLANCFVRSNNAVRGGGLNFHNGSALAYHTLRIKNCEFTDNSGGLGAGIGGMGGGGALFGEYVKGEVVNTQFRNNSSAPQGGGVFLWKMVTPESRLDFTNCVFYANFVTGGSPSMGGGIYLGEASSTEFANAQLVNCTFASNSAGTTGVPGGDAVAVSASSQCAIYNSIFWSNGVVPLVLIVGNPTVGYSDVQGGWPTGTGNIPGGADPLFRNLGAGNLRLIYNPPAMISPCLDAADYSRLPLDNLDVDGDGITNQIMPIDLDVGLRLVDIIPLADTGAGSSVGPLACPTCTYLDMGAYERP